MPKVRLTLVASVAALALSTATAAAADSPPAVGNFGHCVSSSDATDPQDGFGPLVFITGGQPGFVVIQPPGQVDKDSTGIACFKD